MLQRNILAVAGPPLSGKTTVGRILAGMVGFPFLDLDSLVEKAAGIPVSQIFSLHGEAFFRRLESEGLRRVVQRKDPLVLALGGGTLLDDGNLEALAKRAVIFTLHPEEEEILSRFSPGRPLAPDLDRLRVLLEQRREHYLRLPGGVRTTGLSPRETAMVIAVSVGTRWSR